MPNRDAGEDGWTADGERSGLRALVLLGELMPGHSRQPRRLLTCLLPRLLSSSRFQLGAPLPMIHLSLETTIDPHPWWLASHER